MIVKLPGFSDLIHDSQATFKVLLESLSRPSIINNITVKLTPPSRLNIACAAACLTLLDLETQLWLQPGLEESVKNWLLFHTSCQFTEDSSQADFAVIWDLDNMPDLSKFKQGTPIYPENSTTLLVQIASYDRATANHKLLKGAGINGQIAMPIALLDSFWQQWQQNHHSHPLGVDIYFFWEDKVIGLPRTSTLN